MHLRSSCHLLPGQMPVEPLQRRTYHGPLMPASRHDLATDRLGGASQRLAHHCSLLIPGPPTQKMHTADADADLGMAAEMDEGALGLGLAAAPAIALVSLAFLRLGFGAHGGSPLLPT
jgi:hypothetical protein